MYTEMKLIIINYVNNINITDNMYFIINRYFDPNQISGIISDNNISKGIY